MPPKAPSGETYITILTMRKNAWATRSIKFSSGLPAAPSICKAKANRIEMNSTWRISPSAKAPNTVLGTIWVRNPTTLCSWASLL
ncbi:hypothetical protein D3C72_2348550 [compost metagenome]